MESRKYQLNAADMQKVGTGLLIAMTGAGLTYLSQEIPNIDFAEWTPVVVAFYSVVVNLARKYLAGVE